MSYIYQNVTVERVIDGDTVVMAVDMGNKMRWVESFRLMGIDTPERGKPGYSEASEYLRELLAGGVARIETFKPDKYGRWLAAIYVKSEHSGEVEVNRTMIVAGHAVEYFGGTKL